MIIKDVLNLLAYGTQYELIGARTGKTLCSSWNNKKEYIARFHDCIVSDTPIFPSLRIFTDNKCVYPIVAIWVSGK